MEDGGLGGWWRTYEWLPWPRNGLDGLDGGEWGMGIRPPVTEQRSVGAIERISVWRRNVEYDLDYARYIEVQTMQETRDELILMHSNSAVQ